jgi:hypothetical protein
MVEGRSPTGKKMWARSCRTHGRLCVWMDSRALAESAPFISPQEKTATKHLEPKGATHAKRSK